MKQIIFSLFLFAALPLLAQFQVHNYLPIQGRYLLNNQPVTGNYAFTFQLLGTSYTETFTAVPVNNGLYAVVLGSINSLPDTMFKSTNAYSLKVSVNGVPLDTISIFAPIERDPSVPANLKDGVQWQDVQNVPTIVANPNLTLNGTQLSNNGGQTWVTLPSLVQADSIKVGQLVTVHPASPNTLGAAAYNVLPYNSVWQYVANPGGDRIDTIYIGMSNPYAANLRLKIYYGAGVSGQAVYNQLYTCSNYNNMYSIKAFPISSYVPIDNIHTDITFELTPENSTTCSPGSGQIYVGSCLSGCIPVSYANVGSNGEDLIFRVAGVKQNVPFAVTPQTANGGGLVGIGTAAPAYLLHVKGKKNPLVGFQNDSTQSLLLFGTSGTSPYIQSSNATLLLNPNGLGVTIGSAALSNSPLNVYGNGNVTGAFTIGLTNNNTDSLKVNGPANIDGKLTVNGDITLTGGILSSNISLPATFTIPSNNNNITATKVGSIFWSRNKHYYVRYTFSSATDWYYAYESARYLGGHLATFTSPSEWSYVLPIIPTGANGTYGAIGFAEPDGQSYSRIRWITGELSIQYGGAWFNNLSPNTGGPSYGVYLNTNGHSWTTMNYYSNNITEMIVEFGYQVSP